MFSQSSQMFLRILTYFILLNYIGGKLRKNKEEGSSEVVIILYILQYVKKTVGLFTMECSKN